MKRILVVLAMVPMFAQAAELAPGTLQVTGSSSLGFGVGSTKTTVGTESEKIDTSGFGLGATGLYYVIKDLGVGLDLSYASETTKFPATAGGDNKLGTSTLQIGPAVEYDYPIAEKASLFGLGSIGYVTSTDTETVDGLVMPDVNRSGYGLKLGVGARYFVAKSFSLDALLGYQYQKLTEDVPAGTKPEITTSGFGVNVGLSVFFGG